MNQIISAALENRWHEIFIGLKLKTPDNANGSSFVVGAVENNFVEIVTNGGSHIEINRQAFLAALDFLLSNQHTLQNPCQIGANKSINKAGQLCVAVRNANGVNVMIVGYVLPLLVQMKLVQIDGNRPNAVWLI